MIVSIEKGLETIGSVECIDTEEDGYKDIIIGQTNGDISIADIDYDDVFDTDELKLRIQIEDVEESPFRTGNVIGFYHENEDVKRIMQELKSYQALKKSFEKKDYYDCSVLISNYFGHISYPKVFGYGKTHGEICYILLTNMCAELTEGHKTPFSDFVDRQIKKCIGILRDVYDIEDVEQCYENGWLP